MLGVPKKRYHDSRRSTVTTQTQNKTRQNYCAIYLSIPKKYKYCSCIFTYPQTASGRSHQIKQIYIDLFELLDDKTKKCYFIEYLFHEVSTASSRQSAKYLPKFPQLSIPIRN